MKNAISSVLSFTMILVVAGMTACSSTSDPAPDPNKPPAAPQNPVPADQAVDQAIGVSLSWDPATDPDGDSITYDVYMGLVGSPLELVAEDLTDANYTPNFFPGIRFEGTYVWKVVAKDSKGAIQSSEEWTFTVQPCPQTPGTICTWAGVSGLSGLGPEGQRPGETELYLPQDVVFDPSGAPWIIDYNNHRVLRQELDGTLVEAFGGDFGNPTSGQLGKDLMLNHPTHVAFHPTSNEVILSGWHNSLLMRMDLTTGVATTFCGNGQRDYGGDGGLAKDAVLDLPVNVLFDAMGRLYIGDQANMCIRRINPDSTIETVAGTPTVKGYGGDGGPARLAKFSFEASQAAQPSGKICFNPDGDLIVADSDNHCIRAIRYSQDPIDPIVETVAGTPTTGGFAGDGGPATSAIMREPRDVACDAAGNIFIADAGNHCIRVLLVATGEIHTVAGTPLVFGRDTTDGLPATQAKLNSPYGVEVDPNGNLWITNTANHTIRVVWDPLTNVP